MKNTRARAVAAALSMASVTWAAAQSTTFTTRLSTTPIDRSLQATVTGTGSISAGLDGRELVLDGSFAGLTGPATVAHLHVGPATGVRGPAIADLDVDHAASGGIRGTVRLSRSDAVAFGEGRMYVQIDSEPAPEGNLWGWLLP